MIGIIDLFIIIKHYIVKNVFSYKFSKNMDALVILSINKFNFIFTFILILDILN